MSALQSLTLDRDYQCPVDQFGLLAPTLRCLKLSYFPLHSSFLRLRDLTELALKTHDFPLHSDTLLDFLEENRSLESVTLDTKFEKRSLQSSQRQAPIENRLRHLSVSGGKMDIKPVVSNIALQRGAHLEIISGFGIKMKHVLSGPPHGSPPKSIVTNFHGVSIHQKKNSAGRVKRGFLISGIL